MAAESTKIGLVFISDDIGVVYYLVNIVKTLDFLPDSKKPEIVVFYNKESEKFLPLLKYKHLKTIQVEITAKNRIILYLKSFFQRKNLFYEKLLTAYPVNGLFPFNDFPVPVSGKAIVVSWIPDFQHKFYPQFFTRRNLILRERRFKSIINGTDVIVLSSNDALSHLRQFYKVPSNLTVKILQFISMIKNHTISLFSEVKERYQIKVPFFLVSNQFYEHKNHMAVFRAIKILKDEGYQFMVIFSGKMEDYRNPKFYPSLLDYIEYNGIGSHLKILGLIPREDQLSLLVNSLSVIQPSKFEGWSTIIEDAKTLCHQIICSSIPVHVEQLGLNGFYFDADSPEELVEHMRNFINGVIVKKEQPDTYEERVRQFAESFSEIFNLK